MTTTITRAAIALCQQWEEERAKRAQSVTDAKIATAATIGGRIVAIPEDSTLSPIAAAMLAEGITVDDQGEYRPSDEIQALLQAHAAMWNWLSIEGLITAAYQINGRRWITYSPNDRSVIEAVQKLAHWMNVKPKV